MSPSLRRLLALSSAVVLSAACADSKPTVPDASADASSDASIDAPRGDGGITSVPAQETWSIPGLHGEAQVLRTASNVPHIYARDREDLARVQGFVVARDRFFMLDLARRLAQGRLSALLGDAALATDLESRQTGMTYVTQQLEGALTPAEAQRFDAFAAGINTYIAKVREGLLEPPSELRLAAILFGRQPIDMMQEFNRRDIVAMGTTFLYQSGYETGDVGRARSNAGLPGEFTGQALAELRRAGVRSDIFDRVTQIRNIASADGWGVEGGPVPSSLDRIPTPPPVTERHLPRVPATRNATPKRVPQEMLSRLADTLNSIETRLLRVEGFGSNAWAVMGRHTRDGSTLLAADGHLPLTIPSLFYQIGLDTQLLGGGDIHQVGVALPLLPYVAMGTNGSVAWGFTQLSGDITDWYREELTLDASGMPTASRFMGAARPLVRVDERVEVADVPALMSRGRTETVTRFTTFDGRWITAIEGRTVTATEALGPGESRVYLLGQWVVPRDTDGDGAITAVSFDYVGLDASNIFESFARFGTSRTVAEYRQATRGLVAFSLNQVAADSAGSVYYSGYQATPCREWLPRNADRSWVMGADPNLLLDGTRFGGFHIPIRDTIVDETAGATDPYACVVPFERTPASLNPTRGYVFTANNEPGHITDDNSLTNDPYYIGGPWNDGYRAERIDTLLRAGVTARNLDEEAMARVQADARSPLGGQFTPALLDAIDAARTASMGTPAAGTADARLAAMYRAASADFDEVARRLRAWSTADFPTPSGVETFYHTVADGEREHAVATTLFNAWVGRFIRGVFDDERFPADPFEGGGSAARARTLVLMLDGRGPMNSTRLASWNPATQESAWFDVLGTEPIETSREVALSALTQALTYLRSTPRGPGAGGFGTNDMTQYLWGLRHHVRFDSILSSFLGNNDTLAPIVGRFSITPMNLPLASMIPAGDPRATLPGFPRGGDQWVVDAANSGLGGENFTFGSGPTYRMVVSFHSDGTTQGRNVVPGGQSGLNTSPNFSDQAALWLGNRALPMYLAPADVIAHATSREQYTP
ncbi:MAG: penicillin acylase family protein [Polyangiales bacterium]